jgi:hypothetical protein
MIEFLHFLIPPFTRLCIYQGWCFTYRAATRRWDFPKSRDYRGRGGVPEEPEKAEIVTRCVFS